MAGYLSRISLSRVAACLILAFNALACGGWENGWLHIALNSRAGMILTKNETFPVKTQADGGIGLSLEFSPSSFLGFALAYAYHWTGPSNLEGGFAYRAYSGSDVRLSVSLRYAELINNESVILLFGSYQGAIARFDRYYLTSLHFFYPGLFVQPFLELGLHVFPESSMQLSLLLEYCFRHDLVFCASAGLAFSFVFSPLRSTWKKKPSRAERQAENDEG
ncbi:hypothetical protein ES707_20322 [subsurface metagenome]